MIYHKSYPIVLFIVNILLYSMLWQSCTIYILHSLQHFSASIVAAVTHIRQKLKVTSFLFLHIPPGHPPFYPVKSLWGVAPVSL